MISVRNLIAIASLVLPFSSAIAAEAPFIHSASANPTSFFPPTNSDFTSNNHYEEYFFETLLDHHPDTYDWQSRLASKWEVSKDGKEFTFWLNENAKFWDGTPVTAEDVKFSFDVIFMPGVMSAPLKPYYSQISKVEIVDKHQVKFHTKDVYYKNFDVCAGLQVFSKKHYSELYKKDKTFTRAEVVMKPMGSGPYTIERIDQNRQVILKKNPKYWDAAKLTAEKKYQYDRIIYKIIPDETVEFETFKKGEVTMTRLTPKQWALQSDAPVFKTKINKVKTLNKEPKGFNYIAWNNKHPILGDKNVRWAMSHLVNLPVWIQKFDFNLSEPTIGPFSVKSDEHDTTLKVVKYNLKEARKKLALAGWTKADKDGVLIKDGKRFEITLIYPTQAKEYNEPRFTHFKNEAIKVGVQVNLKSVEWTSFIKLADDRNFDALGLAWGRSIDGDVKQIWHTESIADKGSNFVSYSNPEVDKLIDQHRSNMDRNMRVNFARQIQKLVYEDQPYTFLTEQKFVLYAHQKYVEKPKDTFNYEIGTAFWKLKPNQ